MEIKKAEPRDGSGGQNSNSNAIGGGAGYGKLGGNECSHWGPPHAPLNMMQGQNGQMGGPPLNMPLGAPNMMTGYQAWGNSPQQGGYGFGNSGPGSYQGWGAPPGPQGPPPQWSNYAGPQQTQGYGGYDMYNSTSTGGPSGPSGGASWNAWNLPPNSAGPTGAPVAGAGTATDVYSRSQGWGLGGPSTTGPVGGMPRTGPGNSASKSGSEYDYGGYGSYDYDYVSSNYAKQEASASSYGAGPRSAYGNENSTQQPYAASQAV